MPKARGNLIEFCTARVAAITWCIAQIVCSTEHLSNVNQVYIWSVLPTTTAVWEKQITEEIWFVALFK
jgi:hypothetical protein